MKFLIYGAGAVGQGVGCLLAASGHDVHLVLRERYARAIREGGLFVSGIFGDFRAGPGSVSVHESIAGCADAEFDYALITTKSYDTGAAVHALMGLRHQGFFAVSMQNGCGNFEQVLESFGKGRSLAARVITGFEITRPGEVRITVTADSVHVGGPLEGTIPQAAEALAEAIHSSGLPCEATPHIRRDLFGKLLYNCALNPLGAILRVPYGLLGEDEGTREIMESVVREVFAVIASMGEATHWTMPEDYLAVFYERQIPATYDHRSSMLQDLENGKRTEVDALTGFVAREGKARGVPTPSCDLLSSLVRFMEKGRAIAP